MNARIQLMHSITSFVCIQSRLPRCVLVHAYLYVLVSLCVCACVRVCVCVCALVCVRESSVTTWKNLKGGQASVQSLANTHNTRPHTYAHKHTLTHTYITLTPPCLGCVYELQKRSFCHSTCTFSGTASHAFVLYSFTHWYSITRIYMIYHHICTQQIHLHTHTHTFMFLHPPPGPCCLGSGS